MNLSVPAVAESTSATSSVRDAVDVSLHDDKLAAEMALTVPPSQVTPRGRGAADAGRAP